MNASPGSSQPTLQHLPCGEYHPYDPLPYERFPRFPSAGEPVTLFAATGRTPELEAVWCTWQVQGNPAVNRSEGEKAASDDTTDTWRVPLPAFQGGDVVHYRLFARSHDRQVETEQFSFSVSTWAEVVSIAAIEEGAHHVSVVLATTVPGVYLSIHAERGPGDAVSLRLTAGKIPVEAPAAPSSNTPRRVEWAGGIGVTIRDNPIHLELFRNADGFTLRTARPIRLQLLPDSTVAQVEVSFACPNDEAFYGFGERFQALDQRGCYLDNHVFAQYVHQGKRTYIPIPFFLSSRGYGLWLKTDRQATFDMAVQEPACWTITGSPEANGAGLDMIVFLEQTPTRIIQAFTDLTGKPKLPPSWVFGLWLSSNDWNSQVEVLRQLSLSQRHGIPASVMVIEAWSDEITFYIWNDTRYRQKPSFQAYSLDDFTFPEAGHWPDPKAMIDELHSAGLRLVLWQIPVLKREVPEESLDPAQKNADQDYAVQNGYPVRRADGTPHRIEAHSPWFANSLVFDFTHPEGAQWWLDKRRYLLAELGVDGFKTDGGEHIWTPDTRFANGMQGHQGINHYPLAYQGAYHRFLETHRGSDHVLFSRSGYTGIQKVSCHWTGDEASTWEAFRSTIHAMLNAGICGISFLGWDIAGFAGEIPSSDLYLRAAAFSAFCPIMQFHSDSNARRKPSRDRTPWNIQERTGDPRVIPTFRKFANLRMNLFPYIGSEARYCRQTGIPLMRAMPIDFHKDRACRDFSYQYLFGRSLLVAPVVEPGVGSLRVYLPQNPGHPELWYDLWTGSAWEGGQVITAEAPHDLIPVFVRGGSVLPLNLDESFDLGSPVGNRFTGYRQLSFWIFPRSGDAYQEWRDPVSESAFVMNTNYQGSEKTLGVSLPRMPYSPALVIPSVVPPKARVDGQDRAWMQDSFASPWSAVSASIRLAYQLSRLDQPIHLKLDGWACPTSPK